MRGCQRTAGQCMQRAPLLPPSPAATRPGARAAAVLRRCLFRLAPPPCRPQSNHARATAVAARYLGLDCHLVLRNSRHLADAGVLAGAGGAPACLPACMHACLPAYTRATIVASANCYFAHCRPRFGGQLVGGAARGSARLAGGWGQRFLPSPPLPSPPLPSPPSPPLPPLSSLPLGKCFTADCPRESCRRR